MRPTQQPGSDTGLFSSGVLAAGWGRPQPAARACEEQGLGLRRRVGTQLNNHIRGKCASINFSVSHELSEEGRLVDAWALRAEEGRGTLRKAPVRRVQP
jgi:TfoX/Sxy family transcriptional regulator of competence genes